MAHGPLTLLRWMCGKRTLIAGSSCVLGLILVLIGLAVATHYHLTRGSRDEPSAASNSDIKQLPNWNVALADVVIVAPELGFRVAGLEKAGAEEITIRKRIDNQLFGLRQIYRQAVKKNPALMGGIRLRVKVDSSGNVTEAALSSTRLTDKRFADMVAAEAYRWRFQGVVAKPLTIDCPLLFVREGMDITTLIHWEKALERFGENAALIRRDSGRNGRVAASTVPRIAGNIPSNALRPPQRLARRQ